MQEVKLATFTLAAGTYSSSQSHAVEKITQDNSNGEARCENEGQIHGVHLEVGEEWQGPVEADDAELEVFEGGDDVESPGALILAVCLHHTDSFRSVVARRAASKRLVKPNTRYVHADWVNYDDDGSGSGDSGSDCSDYSLSDGSE